MNSRKVVYLLTLSVLLAVIHFAYVPQSKPQLTLTFSNGNVTSTQPQNVTALPTPTSTPVETPPTHESIPQKNESIVETPPTLPLFSFEPLENRVPNNPQGDSFFVALESVSANVKIGFVVMLYENTEMLFRLIKTIYRDYHEYVIVMDTKADIRDWNATKEMYANYTNVRTISRRVCYSTPSMVLVEIEAARMLLERNVDYVTSLSNRDYPVRPLVDLEKFLTLRKGWSFMNVLEVPETHYKNSFSRFYLDVDCTRNGMVPTEQLRPDIGFKMYFGSQWHTMSRELASWILDSPLSFYVISWLSTASNTDEFFWSTMAAYSPYIDKIQSRSMTYVGWDAECPLQPCTLVMPMWQKINETGLFWGRKFKMEDPGSLELMDFIDQNVHKMYK